jgi:myo-inositol-1(or 4)-monophosphatase
LISDPDPLELAIAAASEAGALLREGLAARAADGELPQFPLGRHQRALAKSSDIDLVTEYDRRAEECIVKRLRAAFPGDVVVAEESGMSAPSSGAAAARWLIDPLDGTTNYAHGLPLFCVSIAREVRGSVEIGVVEAPALGLTFAARRGDGATLNGARMHVSDTDSLARSMLATGFPYDRHTSPDSNFEQFVAFQRRAQAVRRLGAAALDLALVAHGTYDGYWEMKLKPWDLAAGALLVEEAGGRVTGWRGEPLAVDRGAAVASNGRIHDELLAVLAATGIPAPAR